MDKDSLPAEVVDQITLINMLQSCTVNVSRTADGIENFLEGNPLMSISHSKRAHLLRTLKALSDGQQQLMATTDLLLLPKLTLVK